MKIRLGLRLASVTVNVSLGLWLAAGGGEARGQAPPQNPYDPNVGLPLPVGGQWMGPWDLSDEINAGHGPPPAWQWNEIAHAVVLPPPNDDWVVFWCPRTCGTDTYGPFETFLWRVRQPGNVIRLTLPSLGAGDGGGDPFCGGHTLTDDGHLVSFGGTDLLSDCPICVECDVSTGHTLVWILRQVTRIDPSDPLTYPQWHLAPSSMARGRWYPTPIILSDGEIVVTGEVNDDLLLPPGTLQTFDTMERGRLAPSQVDFDWVNGPDAFLNRLFLGAVPCDEEGLLAARYYPRMLQLTNGDAMTLVTDKLTQFSLVPFQGYTSFMRRNLCSLPDADRWFYGAAQGTVGGGSSEPVQMPRPVGNSVAHIINEVTGEEVVYSIGGSLLDGLCWVDHDGNPNTPPIENSVMTDSITDKVLRMTDPDISTVWVDETLNALQQPIPLELIRSRTDSNAVILADGSILVVGGLGPDCQSRKLPELYRPPEVFRTGDRVWFQPMNKQASDRRYHGVAALLPNGQVVSAGGVVEDDGSGNHTEPVSAHTVEVYNPRYMYFGARPVVRGLTGILEWGQPINLTVDLPHGVPAGNEDNEYRVALLRPASVTHAFDSNQRYIVVKDASGIDDESYDPVSDTWTIPVQLPFANRNHPPGWYMLIVTTVQGAPSEGFWVNIQNP